MSIEEIEKLQSKMLLFRSITSIRIEGKGDKLSHFVNISDKKLIMDLIMQINISLDVDRKIIEKDFYSSLTKRKTHIPDWNLIPLRFNYFAIDKGGSAYAFETKPFLDELLWRMTYGDCQYIGQWDGSNYKNSLQQRPSNEPPTP